MSPEELAALQDEATKAVAEGRLETARLRLQRGLAGSANHRARRLVWAHEVASLHWLTYGDGIEARDCSELVIVTWKSLQETAAPEFEAGIKPLVLNSMERLILLATSREVCDRWEGELKRVSPDATLLWALHPAETSGKEPDGVWIEGMVERGIQFLRRGQNPPVAACILHLALTRGLELHARPVLWKKAMVGYYLAVHEIAGKANKLFGEKPGAGSEIAPVYKHTLPFLREYCEAHPDDGDVTQYLQHSTKIANALAAEARVDGPSEPRGSSWLQHLGNRLFRRG